MKPIFTINDIPELIKFLKFYFLCRSNFFIKIFKNL